MKEKQIIYFCLISLFIINNTWANNEKRALIITIGNYQNKGEWKYLKAATNDKKLITKILLEQNFLEKNIKPLMDSGAKKNAIIAHMDQFIKDTNEGDIVVVYFSGHGIQIKDAGEKDEKDSLDECIVPYDGPTKKANGTYPSEFLIIDDTIGQWVQRLRFKVKKSGQVLVIVDACHSGTAGKGDENEKFTGDYLDEESLPQSLYNLDLPKIKKNNLGQYIFIGASADRQVSHTLSYNNDSFSVLTLGLYMAFRNIRPNLNYKELLENAKGFLKVNHYLNQKPKIDGDSLMPIFLGKVEKPKDEFIPSIINNKRVKISNGYLGNINKGAKFEFFKNNSFKMKKGQEVASGVVVESNAFESIIEIVEGELNSNVSDVLAVQTEQAFGNHRTRLSFKDFKTFSLQKSLEDIFSNKLSIELSSENSELLLQEKKGEIIISLASSGLIYKKVLIDENVTKNVLENILDYNRAKIIATLEIDNPDFRADVSLRHGSFIQKSIKENKLIYINTTSREDSLNSDLIFDTKQQSFFNIKNVGNKPFYFTLLDIQPDGIINVLLPNLSKKFEPEDLFLAQGQTLDIHFAPPSPPYGTEIYKIIMSSKIEDFAFLNSINRSNLDENKKGTDSPFTALFKDLTDGTMKRTKGTLPLVGGTAEIRFKIILAKK
jgi:metacaspase-1